MLHGPGRWLDSGTRIKCIGWSCTLILRHGNTCGQGHPEIQEDASRILPELLDYNLLNVYEAAAEDLVEVIRVSVEWKIGQPKYRSPGRYGAEGNLIAMACAAVLGIIFLFIVEADIFRCCSRLSFYKVPQPQKNLEYDDDVLKEHERLSK